MVCRLLQSQGRCTVHAMVRRLARAMYDEALECGGGQADIGLLGPRLFERDALAVLERMKDRCLSVEDEEGQ